MMKACLAARSLHASHAEEAVLKYVLTIAGGTGQALADTNGSDTGCHEDNYHMHPAAHGCQVR